MTHYGLLVSLPSKQRKPAVDPNAEPQRSSNLDGRSGNVSFPTTMSLIADIETRQKNDDAFLVKRLALAEAAWIAWEARAA
ncbi:MAG: hypothetical protein ACRYF2_25700 [Janthinobacterium lividum]